MAEILLVFGSDSDAKIYEKIAEALRQEGIKFELRICSAHRTPKELEKIIAATNARAIIAGAGLSAALPGAIAALTTKPVIGIPIASNYNGLDSLLSIHQMPPGIPVLGIGTNADYNELPKTLRKFESIAVVGSNEKAEALLKEFGINYEKADELDKEDGKKIYIAASDLNSAVETGNALAIFIPSAENAQNLLQFSNKGFWVGFNNGKNAALAAIQLLNSDGRFDNALGAYREQARKKVLDADAIESKRVGAQ